MGNFLSGGNVLDGILSGMVNGAVVGLVSGIVPIGGSIVANFAGGVVGGTYNALLGGDNSVKTFASWIGETGYITTDRVAHILLGM